MIEIETEGESRTERVLHTVMLGDLLAIELANLRGVDPLLSTSSRASRRRWAGPTVLSRVRSSSLTTTASPCSLRIALRTSAFIGSLCVPSPSAMNELWNGWPSTVPRTLTRPRVPKYSTESGMTT